MDNGFCHNYYSVIFSGELIIFSPIFTTEKYAKWNGLIIDKRKVIQKYWTFQNIKFGLCCSFYQHSPTV